ncbi:MAG: hypothetical protein AB7G12_00890 [Thermoanaerobaculia bacterium]
MLETRHRHGLALLFGGLLGFAIGTPAWSGCPTGGQVTRDGWTVSYDSTNWDGLEVRNASFHGSLVLTRAKIVEWHDDYGASGYVFTTGCSAGGGGFTIYPYGELQVLDLPGSADGVAGFEIVGDFRMGSWGSSCNLRFDVHYQFFENGNFRIAMGAYGKGCGSGNTYRPVLRIDIAEVDAADDVIARWNGSSWVDLTTEDYFVPYAEAGHGPHAYDPGGHVARILEQSSGSGHLLEVDRGHLADPDLLDEPFLYYTRFHADEGDAELPALGTCCNNDHQQGPQGYLNGESISGEDLVIWYVPQLETVTTVPYSCWTVSGEPNPETYPCFGGPLFRTTPGIFADGFEGGSVGRWSFANP